MVNRVGIRTVLDFVNQGDGGGRGGGPLQPCNEQAPGAGTQRPQRDAGFAVKRDCTIVYRDRVGIEQRLGIRANRHAKAGGCSGDYLQRLGKLRPGLRTEGSARGPRGACDF